MSKLSDSSNRPTASVINGREAWPGFRLTLLCIGTKIQLHGLAQFSLLCDSLYRPLATSVDPGLPAAYYTANTVAHIAAGSLQVGGRAQPKELTLSWGTVILATNDAYSEF